MRAISYLVSALVVLAGVVGYWLTTPKPLTSISPALGSPDVNKGEYVFNAAGCSNCHATIGQNDRLKLGGGHSLKSPFGDFLVPNISSDKEAGIGSWSELEFANAMLRGIGRNGEHLFPSFPYTSYQRMTIEDVRDLFAFLKTVPAENRASENHRVWFPFNIRRGVGLWKFLFFDGGPAAPTVAIETARGSYLVEGPGHCAECHSERNWLGAIIPERRFAGGREPGGKGWIPNITPHRDGLSEWTPKDMEFFLETGFTPDGIAVGSTMADVIRGTSRLTAEDRRAMAGYLKSLPPRAGKKPGDK
jgi:mono/diheme cytochrome c family protein